MRLISLTITHLNVRSLGCIESLVHYKKQFLKKYLCSGLRSSADPEPEQVKNECITLLSTLERLDPYRICRYQEIGVYFRTAALSYILITTEAEQLRRNA